MSEKKEDLRIRRTHKLLCDAMFALLETRSFDEITVVDICEKAMVHRATFYKHFKDKYEFMEYVTKEKLQGVYRESVSLKDYSVPSDVYRTMTESIINFIEENKQIFILSAKSSNSNFFDSIHKIVFEELSDFLANSRVHKEKTYNVPVEVLAQFLTGGFTALVRWWTANDEPFSKEEMAQYLENMLYYGSN